MANIRVEALKQIFKKGVESVSKEDLEQLFKSARYKLHRRDWAPEQLLEEGFKPGRGKVGPFEITKPSGLAWGTNKRMLEDEDILGQATNVEGLIRPGAKVVNVPGEGLSYQSHVPKGEDFIKLKGDVESGWPTELRQLKPGNVLARIKVNNDWKYRILGIAGAIGAGGVVMGEPEEAEAGVVGKVFKLATRPAVAKAPVSRTADKLIGTSFLGKTIKSIVKGRGDVRNIILEDDTVYPTTKNVVTDLLRTNEVKKTTGVFGAYKGKDVGIKLDQALNSMDYHESRANTSLSERTIRANYKSYVAQMKETGVDAAPFSLVRRGDKIYTMPTPYAQYLEKQGFLEILEELK